MPVCLGALVSICFVVVVILPLLLHSYLEATSEDVTKTPVQTLGLDRYLDRYWGQGAGQTAHLPFLNSFCHEWYIKLPNEQLNGTPFLRQRLPRRSSASLHPLETELLIFLKCNFPVVHEIQPWS